MDEELAELRQQIADLAELTVTMRHRANLPRYRQEWNDDAPSRSAWWHGSNGGCNHRRSFWARDRETSTNPSSRLLETAPDQIRSMPQGHGAR